MSQRLLLRPMTLDDLDDVANLDGRAFGESGWSRRYFEGELTQSPISVFYVLADAQHRIMGYFGTWHVVDQLHLCTFAVDPDQQGQGFGRAAAQLRHPARPAPGTASSSSLKCASPTRSPARSTAAADSPKRRSAPISTRIRAKTACSWACRPPNSRNGWTTHPGSRFDARWPGGLLLRWDDRGGQLEERWPIR